MASLKSELQYDMCPKMWNGLYTSQADKEKKMRIEAVNHAEGIFHDTESQMEKFKDHMLSKDAATLKDQIKEIRENLAVFGNMDNTDPEEIKKTINCFLQQSLKLFEKAQKKVKSALLSSHNPISIIASLGHKLTHTKNRTLEVLFMLLTGITLWLAIKRHNIKEAT